MKCSKCGCEVFHVSELEKVNCAQKVIQDVDNAIINDLSNEIEYLKEKNKKLLAIHNDLVKIVDNYVTGLNG